MVKGTVECTICKTLVQLVSSELQNNATEVTDCYYFREYIVLDNI